MSTLKVNNIESFTTEDEVKVKDSLAIGVTAQAEGTHSLAVGVGNVKVADTGSMGAASFGRGSSASGSLSFAQGKGVKAHGLGAFAQGFETEATGLYAHAEGWRSKAL